MWCVPCGLCARQRGTPALAHEDEPLGRLLCVPPRQFTSCCSLQAIRAHVVGRAGVMSRLFLQPERSRQSRMQPQNGRQRVGTARSRWSQGRPRVRHARAYIQRTNDASSILASAQFSRSWRASWRLTACRYEQLTPPVARLAPPRSFSLGIWAPGMRAAGAARRASGLCRALHHSPRAGASSYGRAGKPAGGASATIGPWDLIATRRARRWVVVSE